MLLYDLSHHQAPDPISVLTLTFPRGLGDEVTITHSPCCDPEPDVPRLILSHNSPDVDPSSLTVDLFPSHLPNSITGPRRLCCVGAVVIAVAVVRYKSQYRHFTPGA